MTADHQSHRTRTLWLIGLLHAFTHLYGGALLPLYVKMQQDLKLDSIEQATLIVTVMGVAYFVPSYPQGVLADRLSRKFLLGLGLLVNAAGFIGLAFAQSYAHALACAVIAGLGGSFYHPSATALIAQLFPEARGRAFGLVGIGASAGFFIGPIYTGWRAVGSGNWRAPVLELGVVGIAAAAAFTLLAEERPASAQSPTSRSVPPPFFPTAGFWVLFLAATVLLSLRDFGGSGMASSASLFFQKAHDFNPATTGFALSGLYIASAIGNPLFGHLSDRGRIKCLAALISAAAILMAVFPRVPPGLAVPVLLAYGFFFMATFPVSEAALMEAVPDAVRGRVFGAFLTIAGFVGNLGHWAVGDWVGKLGPRGATTEGYFSLYLTLSLLTFASISALPFLRGIRKREHLSPAAGMPSQGQVLIEP